MTTSIRGLLIRAVGIVVPIGGFLFWATCDERGYIPTWIPTYIPSWTVAWIPSCWLPLPRRNGFPNRIPIDKLLKIAIPREVNAANVLGAVLLVNHALNVVLPDTLGGGFLWFAQAWAILTAQGAFFMAVLLRSIVGRIQRGCWWKLFRDLEILPFVVEAYYSELKLGPFTLDLRRPLIKNVPCRSNRLSSAFFYWMETHCGRFRNLAGEEIRVSLRLPNYVGIPTVRHWRVVLAREHFVVPNYRWVLLMDGESEELFLDDFRPLSMEADVVVYAVSRHVPDPVQELRTASERANQLLVLRMVEFWPDIYFGIYRAADFRGEDEPPPHLRYDYLSPAVRFDPDVLAVVLSSRKTWWADHRVFFDGGRVWDSEASLNAVLRSILLADEELCRHVVLNGLRDSNTPGIFGFLHESVKDDEEFMRYVLHQERPTIGGGGHEGMLRFASSRLRDDKEFVCWACLVDINNFLHASDRLRNDLGLVLELVGACSLASVPWIISNTLSPADAHNDPAIQSRISSRQRWKRWGSFLPSVSAMLEFVKTVGGGLVGKLKRSPVIRTTIPPRSRLKKLPRLEQRGILIRYLRKNPAEYERVVPNALRGDRDVAKAVSTARGCSLSHFAAGSRWRNDKGIVLDVLNRRVNKDAEDADASEFMHVSRRLRGDRDVALAGVRNDARAFRQALAPATDDDEVVLTAIGAHSNGYCSRRCPRTLSSLESTTQIERPSEIQYASARIKNDCIIGMACVRADDAVFDLLGEVPRSDREIVSHAVSEDPLALALVSGPDPEVYDDFDIMLTAVTHSLSSFDPEMASVPPPLKYASDRLRRDRVLVKAALQNNFRNWDYVAVELQVDPEMKEFVRQLGSARTVAGAGQLDS